MTDDDDLTCPHCHTSLHRVVWVRPEPMTREAQFLWAGSGRWRLRECQVCHTRFETREYVWHIIGRPRAST